jgi:hypothetical protein
MSVIHCGFVVGEATLTGGRPGAQVRVEKYLGRPVFDRLPVDLASGVEVVARLDRARPGDGRR